MSRIEHINGRIAIELNLQSFSIIGPDGDHRKFDYRDAEAISAALFAVLKSDLFLDDWPRRREMK